MSNCAEDTTVFVLSTRRIALNEGGKKREKKFFFFLNDLKLLFVFFIPTRGARVSHKLFFHTSS